MDTTPAPAATKAKKAGMVKAKEESEEEDDDDEDDDDDDDEEEEGRFTICLWNNCFCSWVKFSILSLHLCQQKPW